MSETRFEITPQMPQGYEMFSGIEIVQKDDGTQRYNGILEYGSDNNITTQKIPLNNLNNLVELWGYDPNEERYVNPEDTIDDPNELKEITRALREDREELIGELSIVRGELAELSTAVKDLTQKLENADESNGKKLDDPKYPTKETRLSQWRRKITKDSAPPDFYYVDQNGRPYIIVDDERVGYTVERNGNGGKLLAGVALVVGAAALLLAGCERLDDEDKDGKTATTVVKKSQTEIKLEEDLLAAEQKQAEEAEEANEIAKKQLRASQYANKLDAQENKLLLDIRNATRYQNSYLRGDRTVHLGALGVEGSVTGAGGYSGINTASSRGSIYIESGNGFTHEIKDMFPGYSGSQYYAAHQAAVAKFGSNYVTNVPKYTTAQGDIRFSSPGKANIRPTVRTFIGNYLKTH